MIVRSLVGLLSGVVIGATFGFVGYALAGALFLSSLNLPHLHLPPSISSPVIFTAIAGALGMGVVGGILGLAISALRLDKFPSAAFGAILGVIVVITDAAIPFPTPRIGILGLMQAYKAGTVPNELIFVKLWTYALSIVVLIGLTLTGILVAVLRHRIFSKEEQHTT